MLRNFSYLFSFSLFLGVSVAIAQDAETLFKQGEEHYFKKRYTLALPLFEDAIKQDPSHVKAHRYAGDIHLNEKRIYKAKEYFLLSRELAKEPAEDLFRLGQVYLLEENGQSALNSLSDALDNDSDLHLAHYYLGQTYYQLYGNKEKTIYHWETYRDRTPQKDHTKLNKAIEYLKKKIKEEKEAKASEARARAQESKDKAAAAQEAANAKKKASRSNTASRVSKTPKKQVSSQRTASKTASKKSSSRKEPDKNLARQQDSLMELLAQNAKDNSNLFSNFNNLTGWNKLGPFIFNHWSLGLIFLLILIIMYLLYDRSRNSY